MQRKDQILQSAATLFAERGFHGVSMHEIGAACGVSGPALYKHFSSKEHLLRSVLVDISEKLLRVARQRERDVSDSSNALDALIAWHIDFALENRAHIIIQEREWATLGSKGRAEVRRLQREYIDVWVRVLRALRPSLDQSLARAAVQAAFGLLNSTPHSARIAEEQMRELLAAMARNALIPTA